ncbi:MAG TPA: hypothetical protein VGA15_18955 [Bradyrhizobium sp.]
MGFFLGLLPAEGVFPATLVLFGVALGLFGPAFFADFLGDFSGSFLAADFFPAVFFAVFFAVFLAGFFTVFLAFFAPRLLVLARFFSAAAFAVRPRGDLRVFFALRFLTVLLLAVATTISFIAQTRLSGIFAGAASTA